VIYAPVLKEAETDRQPPPDLGDRDDVVVIIVNGVHDEEEVHLFGVVGLPLFVTKRDSADVALKLPCPLRPPAGPS
jgi:hypothetical protein